VRIKQHSFPSERFLKKKRIVFPNDSIDVLMLEIDQSKGKIAWSYIYSSLIEVLFQFFFCLLTKLGPNDHFEVTVNEASKTENNAAAAAQQPEIVRRIP
jgi:hypothetical protein